VAPVVVVFDFDGVIADTEGLHLRCYQDVLRERGLELSAADYYARYLGFDDEGVLRAFGADHGQRFDQATIAAIVEAKTDRYQEVVSREDVLYPGAAESVRRIAAAVPVAIASGALRAEIAVILERAGIADLFRVIVAAGETPRGKPAPDPYLRALELLREHAAIPQSVATIAGRSVAVEDSMWGIRAARAAGMRCVAVTQTYPADQLTEADLVVGSLSAVGLDDLGRLADRSRGV
jgi:HAD superfamily hydrolase (TIGR01509 family)